MLKLTLIALTALAFTGVAHADDSAFPKIEVKGIDPGQMRAGESISFYGKNADDFFRMLPHSNSVDPKEDQKDQKINRELAIVSNGHNIWLSCSKVIYDKTTGNASPNPKGTECKIQLDLPNEGDATDFHPIDAVTRSCRK